MRCSNHSTTQSSFLTHSLTQLPKSFANQIHHLRSDSLRELDSAELADGLDSVVHVVHLGLGEGTHGGDEEDLLGGLQLTDGQGGGGLNISLHGGRHSHDGERIDVEEVHELGGGLSGHGQKLSGGVSQGHGGIGLNGLVLLVELLKVLVHALLEALDLVLLDGHLNNALAGNGVVGSSALNGDHTHGGAQSLEQTTHDVDGVSATKTNIHSRVTSEEVVQNDGLADLVLEGSTGGIQLHVNGEASSATNAHGVLLLRVDVDHVLGLQDAGLQSSSSEQTSLLITSDQDFQRSVLDLLILEDGEAGSDTSTIISTQRGTSGHEPLLALSLDNAGGQRILLEVNLDVVVLLDDHIHMGLKADARLILTSGVSSLSHDEVLALINVSLAAELLGLLLEEGEHLLVLPHLVSHVRSTRNLGESHHVLPNALASREFLHQFLNIATYDSSPSDTYAGSSTDIIANEKQ